MKSLLKDLLRPGWRRARRAFDAAMRDSELIAEAQRATLDLNPGGGDEAQDIIAQIASTPRTIVDRTRKYLD